MEPARVAEFKQEAEPIAIIGMAGRFPGCENLDDLWRHLAAGDDLVREVPVDRWSVADHFSPDRQRLGKTYSKWGALLDGIDIFDPEFFHLTPREATSMDPQQRILLEVAWETLENAGYAGPRIRGSNTGVFVGGMGSEYLANIVAVPERIDAHAGTGNVLSILANRLSFLFDLQGPCLALDTAWSSSLVAVHLAVQSLRRGECEQALVGGSQVGLTLSHYLLLSRLGALSPRGDLERSAETRTAMCWAKERACSC
ncbi:MAG: polyketide synthase [Planctomycetota bacterium]